MSDLINNKICPICKEVDVSNLAKLNKYFYCSNCQFAWLKKLPKPSYGEDYYQGKSNLASKLFNPIGQLLYQVRSSYAKRSVNLWIDIGAGEGNFLKTVSSKHKIGVEISDAGRKLMKIKGIATLSNKQFLKTKGLSADVISLWHTLEHVEDPRAYLLAISKNIQKKGQLIIAVPNIDSFDFKLFGDRWFHLAPDYHLWHFSPRSLSLLLKQTGFVVQEIDHFAIEHHLTGSLQSLINTLTDSQDILHKLVKRSSNLPEFSFRNVLTVILAIIISIPSATILWLTASIFRKGGAIVVIATKK